MTQWVPAYCVLPWATLQAASSQRSQLVLPGFTPDTMAPCIPTIKFCKTVACFLLAMIWQPSQNLVAQLAGWCAQTIVRTSAIFESPGKGVPEDKSDKCPNHQVVTIWADWTGTHHSDVSWLPAPNPILVRPAPQLPTGPVSAPQGRRQEAALYLHWLWGRAAWLPWDQLCLPPNQDHLEHHPAEL